jgi:serine protease Do
MSWKSHGKFFAAGILALLSLIIGVIIGSTLTTATVNPPGVPQELKQFSDAFAEIAERVNPSVVNITCTERGEVSENEENTTEEDLENQYGFGSGVIIDSIGFILTSNHVVESAGKIEVKLSNNQKFVAKLVGQDKETDLALIKVDSNGPLPTAPLGNSERLRPGEWVMAIGNPFVYDHTVTVGVISALNRNLGTNIFDNFIQTDAAINFGNSGGPLLNVQGEVIGINTLISSQGTGIGFAIPINTAKDILPQLKEKGRVVRGFLGLVPQEITSELQKSLGLQDTGGVIISSIQRGTPADRAGLKRYDVIVELNGQKVSSEDQFRRIVAEAKPGTKIRMKVIRDKKVFEVESEITERSDTGAPPSPPKAIEDKIGLKVTDLSQDLRNRLRLPEDVNGLLVLSVKPGTDADTAGLQKGDLIVEANRQPVGTASSFEKQIRNLTPGNVLLLYVLRENNYLFLTLKSD